MGCGKSTIGQEIAKSTNCIFVDTDAWIENKEGMAISDIFATKGEVYFRNLETKCLQDLLKDTHERKKEEVKKIISVGG